MEFYTRTSLWLNEWQVVKFLGMNVQYLTTTAKHFICKLSKRHLIQNSSLLNKKTIVTLSFVQIDVLVF